MPILPKMKSAAFLAALMLWAAILAPATMAAEGEKAKKMTRKERIAARKEALGKMSKEELKEFIDATNLRKRKQKGFLKKKEVTLSQILFPGVAPEEYIEGQEVPIYVDLVDSRKTQLPIEYHRLPVCKPAKKLERKDRKRKNLGEKLMGHNVQQLSPYELKIMEDKSCEKLCTLHLKEKDVRKMKKLIKRQYAVNLSLDGLPVYMYDMNQNAFRGAPLGSKLVNEATDHMEFYLHNHFRFTILYNSGEGPEGTKRIVGFRVKPVSIIHNDKSCGSEKVVNMKDTLLKLDIPKGADQLEVVYSYEVDWEEDQTAWADRWDVYLRGRPDESLAHHMSIINSFMVVIFLGSVLTIILVKALRKDLAVYNDISTDISGGDEEETGWKLVHGDVFRPPSSNPMVLSVLVGTGAQIVVAVSLTLLLGITKLLNPMNKGQALSTIVMLYIFCGTVSGYVSARLFKFCGGKNWKLNTIYTATAFPGVMVSMFLGLNVFLSLYGSAKSVSIWTIICVFLLWVCVATPLIAIGSFIGYKREAISVPTRTNQIARVVPEQHVTLKSNVTSLVIGGMPFSTICIEVYFIMGAIWMHQYYYLMGYLLACGVLLSITCALLSAVMCYLRLCAENHRWWWVSFTDTSTAGLWLFIYSLWYLMTKLQLVGLLPIAVYITYMGMISVAFGLFCGSVGFLTTFMFVKVMYGALKID